MYPIKERYVMDKLDLKDRVGKKYLEHFSEPYVLGENGFYFSCQDESDFNKSIRINTRVIPQYIQWGNNVKVIIVNLNMGAATNDMPDELEREYSPYDPGEKFNFQSAVFNYVFPIKGKEPRWTLSTSSREYWQTKAREILQATSFQDIENTIYADMLHFFEKGTNTEITDERLKKEHAIEENIYWFIISPLLQLKFGLSKDVDFMPLGLIVDDYYSGVAKDTHQGKLKLEKQEVVWDSWYQYFSSRNTPLKFRDDSFLKHKIHHFDELALLQLFPYSSKGRTSIENKNGEFKDVWQKSTDFIENVLKEVKIFNESQSNSETIKVVFNRDGLLDNKIKDNFYKNQDWIFKNDNPINGSMDVKSIRPTKEDV